MQFNEVALQSKEQRLDSILEREDLLRQVLHDFSKGRPCAATLVKRPWEPGGGSSLFSLQVGESRYFLKVKSNEVLVESKLEGEPAFKDTPSLRNEFEFLQKVKSAAPNTPQFFEYAERDGHGFLFLEQLSPFEEGVARLDAAALLRAYKEIEATVRKLFDMGIVHTDVHENNITFRDDTPVLVDFEEARTLAQSDSFEHSLDVAGRNDLGDVGKMPASEGTLGGLTCLRRLEQVFRQLITPKVETLVRECNFDSACPYLKALDHGDDDRIYQSIKLPGLEVAGQRPLNDKRIDLIDEISHALFSHPFTHLDIGSKIGVFNIELEKRGLVERTIGVEAHHKYIELAQVLAFLNSCQRTTFIRAECGVDRLCDLIDGPSIDLVTIYSVYHHIPNREIFLEDLKRLGPRYLMLEMAVQPECYDGRTWEDEIARLSAALEMPNTRLLAYSDDYARPIVLVSREKL